MVLHNESINNNSNRNLIKQFYCSILANSKFISKKYLNGLLFMQGDLNNHIFFIKHNTDTNKVSFFDNNKINSYIGKLVFNNDNEVSIIVNFPHDFGMSDIYWLIKRPNSRNMYICNITYNWQVNDIITNSRPTIKTKITSARIGTIKKSIKSNGTLASILTNTNAIAWQELDKYSIQEYLPEEYKNNLSKIITKHLYV